jgi:hypothetical protein
MFLSSGSSGPRRVPDPEDEDEDAAILQNVQLFASKQAQHPRRLESSCVLQLPLIVLEVICMYVE